MHEPHRSRSTLHVLLTFYCVYAIICTHHPFKRSKEKIMVWSRFFKDFGKRLLWLASICLGLVVAFHVWNFVSLLVWRWLVGMDGCDGSWGLRCYSDREFLDFAVWTNQAFWARLFSVIILVIVTNVLWYLIISPLIREYWRTHDTCHNKACTCVLHPSPTRQTAGTKRRATGSRTWPSAPTRTASVYGTTPDRSSARRRATGSTRSDRRRQDRHRPCPDEQEKTLCSRAGVFSFFRLPMSLSFNYPTRFIGVLSRRSMGYNNHKYEFELSRVLIWLRVYHNQVRTRVSGEIFSMNT